MRDTRPSQAIRGGRVIDGGNEPTAEKPDGFKKADIAKSLLRMISNNIAQIAERAPQQEAPPRLPPGPASGSVGCASDAARRTPRALALT